MGKIFCVTIQISIHAPTRGATPSGEERSILFAISIHAPTRGATHAGDPHDRRTYFKPRSHQRSDAGDQQPLAICVHYFNPRSHKGSDISIPLLFVSFVDFNPRSHKGSDCGITLYGPPTDISIHAPTRGATVLVFALLSITPISIHAPTRGATRHDKRDYEAMQISIHAPTRGATAILHKIPYLFYFIFTNPFPISYFHTQPASDF